MLDLPTTEGGFRIAAIDPPWSFKSNSRARPGRNAMRHYDCMTLAEIKALPVGDMMAPDSLIALWITGPFLALGAHLPLFKAWGFKVSGMGFDWIKVQKGADLNSMVRVGDFHKKLHMGGGFTTRKNAEYVVLAKRGKSVRRNAGVRSTIISKLREHSRKPDEFYQALEAYGAGPYVELFARQSRAGWATWGDQAIQFDPAPELSASMVLRPRFNIAAQITTLGADSLLPPERLAA